MKVLYVTGGDHAALFVEDEFGINNAVKLAEENGGNCIIEDDENYAEVKILEFGEVDIEFVRFINNNFIDYDFSKDTDYFIIEEE